MGKNTGQIALLAAGYLLARTKSMKTVLLLAGGVAYGRMTAKSNEDGESSGSILSRFSPDMERITSGLADAAREAVTATASKGVDSLNQNLQNRSAALRPDSETGEDPEDEQQEAEDSEESEETSEEATKGGDR